MSILAVLLSLLGMAAVLAIPVWLITVVVKLVLVALPRRRPDWGVNLLRWGSVMAAVAAADLYLIGLGLVRFAASESESGTDSAPSPSCRDEVPGAIESIAGYEPSYVPLGFDCILDDGTTYPGSGIYAWLNGIVLAFVVAAIALRVAGGYAAERRARKQTET
ncbi:hypothetical protein GCM10010420_06980 [Streptomyces glaucosporus]|uniref:Integral membrane protein n=1 Tax=Streptomyces glaucosporus TaxID=284044 RepID=A0ABN3HS45_9ACTN